MTSSTAEGSVKLGFAGQTIACPAGTTVLDALTQAGHRVPSSCRSGVCQSCLLRAVSGAVPTSSQAGLKSTWQKAGLFLACQCHPTQDLEIALPDDIRGKVTARLLDRCEVGPDVFRLRLAAQLEYEPGQFVTVAREDGVARTYSLASLRDEPHIELHVRRIPGGALSTWLADEAVIGTEVDLLGPAGQCFYIPEYRDAPLVLAGVGTGLAPLWGIAREALRQGHAAPIALYHGAVEARGLYLHDELVELQNRHDNLRVYFSTLQDAGADSVPLDQLVLRNQKNAQAKVFLCGDPPFVQNLRKKLFLSGVAFANIHADPFTPAAPATPAV